ncbi:MAG: bifunctional phosphoribosylaminoimidazolecarboxamide formyltransferase/IMP cyclohydrolase, partial [Defluviitaleaceae bacterium]|nr:bifunctional phosphoribosylaminoimidazolecarboxamide formyltransferase/IMP cyclohydrolase [Defluviitaleaceae bacterium]
KILEELAAGEITLDTKKELMAKAFRHTAAYDALIAGYFTKEAYPETLTMTFDKKQDLRYGENPHQQAALYSNPLPTSSILTAKQLHGKELSYINIQDADVALSLVKEFDKPAVVAVKHSCPCGVGVGSHISSAYDRAYKADPVSIFGGIVAFNREVDEKRATKMNEIFLEIIIAPSFSDEALKILTKKKNLRLLQVDMETNAAAPASKQLVSVAGGLLVQEKDNYGFSDATLSFPTIKKPTDFDLEAAKFAWTVVKYVKSNGIIVTRKNMTVGIGTGQVNRVGAAKIAIANAGNLVKDTVLASDAMIPMPDTVDLAAEAGISVIIQTGGSIRDQDVIDACDMHGIAMIFTGVRHFRH